MERDLPALGGPRAPEALRRFWGMLAHVHGGVWNAADPARSLGIGESVLYPGERGYALADRVAVPASVLLDPGQSRAKLLRLG